MSLRNRLTGFIASLGLVATLGIAAQAQQTATTDKAAPQAQAEGMGKGKRGHHGLPLMRLLRNLDLTEAQQTQARAIAERFIQSIQPQIQDLKELHQQVQEQEGTSSDEIREKARSLRSQIKDAGKLMQSEVMAILTPEQHAKFEQLEQEWKARRAEHRGRRGRGDMMPPPDQQKK